MTSASGGLVASPPRARAVAPAVGSRGRAKQRKRAWERSVPVLLWGCLWLNLNSGFWNFAVPESASECALLVGAILPFVVLPAALLLVLRQRKPMLATFSPSAFLLAYGVLAMTAALLSPSPWIAFYWSIPFLACLATSWACAVGRHPVRAARQLLQVTWAVTFVVVAIIAYVARGSVFGGGATAYAVGSELGGLTRSSGVARWAAVPGLVCLLRAYHTRRPLLCAGFLAAAGASFFIVYRVQSRGAVLGSAAALLFALFTARRLRRYALPVLLLAGVTLSILQSPQFVADKVTEYLERGQSAEEFRSMTGRTRAYENGLAAFRDAPFLGRGHWSDRLIIGEHVHNSYLQALLSAGVPGGVAYLASWIAGWILFIRLQRRRRRLPPEDRLALLESGTVMMFFTIRSLPETTTASFAVDLLVMAAVYAYLETLAGSLYRWKRPAVVSRREESLVLAARRTPALSERPAVIRRLPQMPEPRVLISAYACGPNWGSEIGVGWNWVTQIARQPCTLAVITERGFREEILDVLPSLDLPRRPEFHFVDVGEAARRRCWNQGDWRFYGDYRNWQLRAFHLAERLIAEEPFDLCHQLNMIGYREPGYLWRLPLPFVWGPVGGHEQMPWRFIPSLGAKQASYHIARNLLNGVQARASLRVHRAARAAAHLIAATPVNRAALLRFHGVESTLIAETGTFGRALPKRPAYDGQRPLRVVWCGRFLSQKALPIALRALALANRAAPVELVIIGDGREGTDWRRLAKRLGVDQHCRWLGALPHQQSLATIVESDCMLLTSIQDATSTVVMESLDAGVPIACHDTCGFGAVVDSTCGAKVPLVSPTHSIRGFAHILITLSRDPELLARLSAGAKARAQQHTWEKKAEAMVEVYRSAMLDRGRPVAPELTYSAVAGVSRF